MIPLRRDDAHALVDEAYLETGTDPMRALAAHWDVPGHWNERLGRDDWYYALHDFIDSVASGNDDARGYGPKDSDDTGLTAP